MQTLVTGQLKCGAMIALQTWESSTQVRQEQERPSFHLLAFDKRGQWSTAFSKVLKRMSQQVEGQSVNPWDAHFSKDRGHNLPFPVERRSAHYDMHKSTRYPMGKRDVPQHSLYKFHLRPEKYGCSNLARTESRTWSRIWSVAARKTRGKNVKGLTNRKGL